MSYILLSTAAVQQRTFVYIIISIQQQQYSSISYICQRSWRTIFCYTASREKITVVVQRKLR